jgi:hypothetical protein
MTTSKHTGAWEDPIENRTPEQRRLRAEHAGEIMAEPLPLNKSSSRVLAQQFYSVPDGKAPKPGPVGRWFGYVLGTVVAGGVVTLVAILIGKAIVWAWNL